MYNEENSLSYLLSHNQEFPHLFLCKFKTRVNFVFIKSEAISVFKLVAKRGSTGSKNSIGIV